MIQYDITMKSQRPVIGISSSKPSSAGENYVLAVRRAGGVPVIIPITDNDEELAVALSRMDGLLLTGGPDVEPYRYGEHPLPELGKTNPPRDEYELKMARMAIDAGLPVLAICRGIQILNVAFGGTLYQDIPTQIPEAFHVHKIKAENAVHHDLLTTDGSTLRRLLGVSTGVNTSHHQAVKQVAPGFVVTAYSDDGIIEGIEMEGTDRVIGVQFHPESSVAEGNDSLFPLFEHLIRSAGNSSQV